MPILTLQARASCLLVLSIIIGSPTASAQSTVAQIDDLRARFAGANLVQLVSSGDSMYRIRRGREKPLIAKLSSSGHIEVAVEGDVLISLKPGENRQSLQRALIHHSPRYSIVEQVSERGVFLLRATGVSVLNPWAAASDVGTLDLARLAEPNYLLEHYQVQQGIKVNVDQWSLDYDGTPPGFADVDGDIDGSEALSKLLYWRNGTLKSVVVAVIDTGADVMHPGLKNRLWSNPNEVPGNKKDDDGDGRVDDVHGWNFDQNTPDLSDINGHGTHIAGIIAAEAWTPGAVTGIAPNVSVMVLKHTASSNGQSSIASTIMAIDYASRHKARVLSMSFGSNANSSLLWDALRAASIDGALLVAAAGNDGKDLSNDPVYPCVWPIVLCVASTDKSGTRSAFSNYSSSGNIRPIFAAPGNQIVSTLPGGGYGPMSGTSMATPHVTAALAVLYGAWPLETNEQILYRLLSGGDSYLATPAVPSEGRRLNLYRALMHPVLVADADGKDYCRQVFDYQVRYLRLPFANSGEPGIDGSSLEKAFTICSAKQLVQIRGEHMNRHFRLATDIDWNSLSDAERRVLGDDGRVFQGSIDGGLYTIMNFSFNNPTATKLGLIRELGPQGSIFNLRLSNVDVRGADQVGAVVGVSNGVLNNVQVDGRVQGRGAVGGIVGRQKGGLLRNGFFEGAITGEGKLGGIVGIASNAARLEQVFAKGYVRATSGDAGGLVGEASFSAEITKSLAQVRVEAESRAGGAVGLLKCGAAVTESFTEKQVVGATAGGLVAQIENGRVVESYSLTIPTGTQSAGGLVASIADHLAMSNGGGDWVYECTGTKSKAADSIVDRSYLQDDPAIPRGVAGKPLTAAQLEVSGNFAQWKFGQTWGLRPNESPSLLSLPRTGSSLY